MSEWYDQRYALVDSSEDGGVQWGVVVPSTNTAYYDPEFGDCDWLGMANSGLLKSWARDLRDYAKANKVWKWRQGDFTYRYFARRYVWVGLAAPSGYVVVWLTRVPTRKVSPGSVVPEYGVVRRKGATSEARRWAWLRGRRAHREARFGREYADQRFLCEVAAWLRELLAQWGDPSERVAAGQRVAQQVLDASAGVGQGERLRARVAVRELRAAVQASGLYEGGL